MEEKSGIGGGGGFVTACELAALVFERVRGADSESRSVSTNSLMCRNAVGSSDSAADCKMREN